MRGNNKRTSRGNTSNKRRTTRLSFRDKIRSQFKKLIKQEQCFIVEPSKEPEGNKDYIVVYESETDKGFGCGKIFKGTEKQCRKLAKELNKVKGELE